MILSLDSIKNAISLVDPTDAYQGISYNLSANNRLESLSPWWVSMPFNDLASFPNGPNPSPLEAAVLQCIPDERSEECFIDILHLADHDTSFFSDSSASTQIVDAFAQYFERFPPQKLTIRLLEGFVTPLMANRKKAEL